MSNPKKFGQEPNSKANRHIKEIKGLDFFAKSLERDFFADANVQCDPVDQGVNRFHLNIHLKCNFGLTESLFHLNNGNWGSFHRKNSRSNGISPFQNALYQLNEENQKYIDIYELSIHLRDTSLIITKIYEQSIADQLGRILNAVSENFVHFTKGLSEMPYEIFVPVFEENESGFMTNKQSRKKSKDDYFDYWGLYFDSNTESAIYDLKNKSIVEGDFFLLNH